MIHLELLENAYSTLRLSRQYIRKMSHRWEDPDAFVSVMGDRLTAWMKAWFILFGAFLPKGEVNRNDARSLLARYLKTMVGYVRAGERTFSLSKPLAQLLAETDLPEIVSDDLQLPFKTIYIEFAPMFTVTNDREATMHVHGCYVTDHRPYENYLSIVTTLDPRGAQNAFLGCVGPFPLELVPGKPIKWSVLRDNMLGNAAVSDSTFMTKVGPSEAYSSELFVDMMMSVIVNTILYATSASPDLTEEVSEWRRLRGELERVTDPKRRKKLEEQIAGASRGERCRLGGSITVSYGVPSPDDVSDEARAARQILLRHRVRGHWRQQPYGPRNELRRPKWIAPFWKGPEDLAERLRRRYSLK